MADRDDYVEALLDQYCPPSTERRRWKSVLADANQDKPTRAYRRLAVPVAATFAAVGVMAIVRSNDHATVLQRAAAAIAAPAASQVLFENMTVHPGQPGIAVRVRLWLEGATPHRFRVQSDQQRMTELFSQPEVSGVLGTTQGLAYSTRDDAPDAVSVIQPFREINLNPVAFLRTALTSHNSWTIVRQAGATTINGRPVARIVVAYQPPGHPRTTVNYFVDARTYQPVRVVINNTGLAIAPTSILTLSTGYLEDTANLVYDFSNFRYLAATQENVQLTNLQATGPRKSTR